MKHLTLPALSLLVLSVVPAPTSAASAPQGSPGSPGLGDPLYPSAGNGGYDVQNYDLTLDYHLSTNQLTASAVITAKATQGLSSFNLDFVGFTITRLTVNGVNAPFTRSGQELVVTPSGGIGNGNNFTVRVNYSGTPTVITDPDEAIEGWIPTDDGAFVVGEPQGSPGWYPVNDNPRDKATYDFRVTVPDGLTVMANGRLVSNTVNGGRRKWVWRSSEPMAPYLATATVGVFDLTITTLPGGIQSYVAVDPHLGSSPVLGMIPDIIDYFSTLYGPYPFDATGAIVDSARMVGYALETQTKPIFDRVPNEATLVHELSHQWFGDSVTLTTWNDLWLHEGFATFSEWIWSETHGGKTAQKIFDEFYNKTGNKWLWEPPAGDPGAPELLFSASVYIRGGMTLQALRVKVGDATFFQILRDWAAENRHSNVTTADFIALAESESGQSLAHFFDVWLYRHGRPASW